MCWCNTLPNPAEETGVSHQLWIHTRQTKIVLLHKYLLAVGRGSRHHLKHLYRYNGTGQLKHAKKIKVTVPTATSNTQHSAAEQTYRGKATHSLDLWTAGTRLVPLSRRTADRQLETGRCLE